MALTGSYLDRDELAARTIAPTSLVQGDFIDPTGAFSSEPYISRRNAWRTFVDSTLIIETSRINTRLRKRYAVPFEAATCPEIVRGWLVAAVTPLLYKRRGVDQSDAQFQSLLDAAEAALAEQKEAADSNEGLLDLPIRQDTTETGISLGGPLGYSEPSPYDWLDVQREAVGE